jgi:hypothetical protein
MPHLHYSRAAALLCLGLLGATPTRPSFSLWGIALRQPIDGSAVEIDQCMSGRQFAFRAGRYRITTDDALLNVPHEHQDSGAVLAALDSVTACFVSSRTRRFAAFLTLRDSLVTDASIFWPDSAGRPTVAAVIAEITAQYGRPLINEYGGAEWEADSAIISVTPRGMFLESVAVTMSDRAACEWFERLIHRRTPRIQYRDADTNQCWAPRTDGGTR